MVLTKRSEVLLDNLNTNLVVRLHKGLHSLHNLGSLDMVGGLFTPIVLFVFTSLDHCYQPAQLAFAESLVHK